MEKITYQIKLDNFEGPMDLLFYLIKREEVNIYDIPIARVTQQYMEYIELIELLDLSLASDFILMAAILIQIKSKMLLPIEEVNLEEELQDDPRSPLVQGLIEYKKFKEAAMELERKSQNQENIFTRLFEEDPLYITKEIEDEDGFVEATLFDLLTAFKNAIDNIPVESFHEVNAEEWTVEDKINYIKNTINEDNNGIYFSELMANCRGKLEVIVTFIAILELIKQQEIKIRQQGLFGEIKVYPIKNDIPSEVAEMTPEEILV